MRWVLTLSPVFPMSKCRKLKLRPRLPSFTGYGKHGERHILDAWLKKSNKPESVGKRTMALMDVAVDDKTGQQIRATAVRASDLRFQVQELLRSIGNPEPWQAVVAIETDRRIRTARGHSRKNWIFNTGCMLVERGEGLFFEIREKLSTLAGGGWLTFGQLSQAWLAARAEYSVRLISPRCRLGRKRRFMRNDETKTLHRWIASKPWTDHTEGGHSRIRVCDDSCWWFVKQLAADLAREHCKKRPHVNRKGLQMQGGKVVGIERRTRDTLEYNARLYTKTVGMTFEEIIEELKTPDMADSDLPPGLSLEATLDCRERLASEHQRMKIWDSTLSELPEEFFRRDDRSMLSVTLMKLRQDSLSQKKSGHVTIKAFAKELGVSRSTLYDRRKKWLKFYRKWNREKEHQRTVSADQIDRPKSLEAQGIQVTHSPEIVVRPVHLPKNYAEVAKPHLDVVRLYETKSRDSEGKKLTRANLVAYVKSLEADVQWSVRERLKEEGYGEDKLYVIGFPRPRKPRPPKPSTGSS
jgi:transposase-like protein